MAILATPTYLLTGFLGSGKTTLLNNWLKQPEFSDVAVIVNEFGAVGIDNDLISKSDEDTIELTTGCLCCTVRGSLVETLMALYVKREQGQVRHFNAVVIETTGLADPVPVIQALMTTPVSGNFHLAKVITTVEAPQGLSTIDRHAEAAKQVAVADDIVITKGDLVAEGHDDIANALKTLNPGAPIHNTAPSAPLALSAIIGSGPLETSAQFHGPKYWQNADDTKQDDRHHHRHDLNRHNSEIGSFVLTFDEPLRWQEVAAWMDALVIAHGEDILRVKGILEIENTDQPIVVQSVQKLFHPPFALEQWPEGTRQSRVVFITRAISESFVREVFDIIRSARKPSTPPSILSELELTGAAS
ncbi:MAG: GTP-binding protein [Confluentimicrobium sp.]|uniref:CobW family GTP-binding protein n=1 Tax=Actibacterium sp. TaxID=1872125 RepID=UPI000C367176|nr:GTP-binding protein [Actibacterium sp.]MBC57520.1 GTP-binding protein [Actibacterium sp.]|tara:strand:- start:4722 stop:5798 length:1077 start_codon:yes stop_codon:yes gene_type:complete